MLRLAGIVWLCALSAVGRAQAPPAVPRVLSDWQAWVLKDKEFHRCPWLAGSDSSEEDSHRCAWPERLELIAEAHGGRFAQRWQVYAESWVALPGDLVHWPRRVRLDGRPVPLVERDGVPSVRLAPGAHRLSGDFAWPSRPETLAIPAATALIGLSVEGRAIARPERSDTVLALGRGARAAEPRELEVQVYRLIRDDIPLRLTTRVQLRAAGDAREELLAGALPAGFIPVAIASELPARLESDGRLRVQVRAGSFEISLEARQAEPASFLTLPQAGREEVWSFAANDRLRVATAEGVAGIDPAQASVPEPWRRYPAFRMQPAARLQIIERSRGIVSSDQNRLRLMRRVWLDFDHGGLTAVDELRGTLRRDWRLAMRAPYELASAHSGDDWLLITRAAGAAESGVELRDPNLRLTTVSRTAHPFAALPATGWSSTLESAQGELYLPPGHRLLAVLGADAAPSAWLERWSLAALFGVLLVVVGSYWIAGTTAAVIAALALLLTYQAAPGLLFGWANLLVAIALARLSVSGWPARLARSYRALSLALLALALLPLIWSEARDALYPQLPVREVEPPLVSAISVVTRATTMEYQMAPVTPAALSVNAPQELTVTAARRDRLAQEASVRGFGGLGDAKLVAKAMPPEPPPRPPVTRYAAGTLIQAGPGIPSWDYGAHPFSWSGPVEPEQTVRFVVLGPWAVALWRVAGATLLALLFVALAGGGSGAPRGALRGAGGLAAAVLLACAAAAAPERARAQSTPDAQILNALGERLTEAPRCAPSCAELTAADVQVIGDRMRVELEASALTFIALPVPAGEHWRLDAVTVDGASSLALTREADAALWLPLRPGVHHVHLEGALLADNVQLAFPMMPRAISLAAAGWDATGVDAGRLVSGTLVLTRQRHAGVTPGTLDSAGGGDFPPFVEVTRTFHLDVDWSVITTVARVAPRAAALTVGVPLVSGESVLTEGLTVRADGTVLVGFGAGQDERQWASGLAQQAALRLHMTATPARAEVWRFEVSPLWRVTFRGPPALLPQELGEASWVFEYRPQVGETLEVLVSRPQAVPGSTLAIDAVTERTAPGRRSTEHELELRYRATAGGRHSLSLPRDAIVTALSIDGAPSQLRPERGELPLTIVPGSHTVEVSWRSPQRVALLARSAPVDLHAAASNVTTELTLPQQRWLLAAFGPGVGPALLYWVELLVFGVLAFVLGRLDSSPLRTTEWLALGLGLSTLSWWVLLLAAAWLYALRWREQWQPGPLPERVRFNLLQCALTLLTLAAVTAVLVYGVRYGLLGEPDMRRAGGGTAHTYVWFNDQAHALLPQPLLLSVPLWVYRALMFLWGLWVVLALTRWLRRSARVLMRDGPWRRAPPRPAAGASDAASPAGAAPNP